MDHCQNCNQDINGNFCSNCGQKKYKRIDKKYIWDEIQYTILHTNKGFLYSVKNILKNPGATAKEFIEGNRVNHYKPILLAFVLSGLSAFVSYKVLGFKEVMTEFMNEKHLNSNLMTDMMSFITSYNSILMLFMIPLFALITKIGFRKWGHNYYEHVVMNAYIVSFYNLVSILVIYPIMFAFRHNPDVFFTMTQMSVIFIPFILLWFFMGFYKERTFKAVLIRVLGVIALTLLFYVFLVVVVSLLAGIVMALIKGPEAMKYIQPR